MSPRNEGRRPGGGGRDTERVARAGGAAVLAAALLVAALAGPLASPARAQGPDRPEGAPAGPVGHVGRWLTDADGRVLLLRGVNLVRKTPPLDPADAGFDDDDAQLLADSGFDAVRLGIEAYALMPSPGEIDTAYLDQIASTVDTLAAHGLRVLLDFHQDGWGPAFRDNGFPVWMTFTNGATDTGTPFPLYYLTNPAIQAAFQSFWDNVPGPGGVPLQERAAAWFEAVGARFAGNDAVLGYDLLNEPWPGTTWLPCVAGPQGCPDLDQAYLDAYYARAADALRRHDPDHLLFGEPWVLFNFGQSTTSIDVPGGDAAGGMSFHVYTTDPALDPVVVANAVDWTDCTGGALLNTEFGATGDVATLQRQTAVFESALVPWMFWSYDEQFVHDLDDPATGANVNAPVVDALSRPHAVAVAGTPLGAVYDPAGGTYQVAWSTTGPDGTAFPPSTTTVIDTNARAYPAGYDVHVDGGQVTSAPDDPHLTVVADPGAERVTVMVGRAGDPGPVATGPPAPAPASCPSFPAAPAPTPVVASPSFTG